MIEVEKNFILTEKQEKRLTDGAEFLGEKKIVDVYYDDLHYSLGIKDTWLRNRNGKFELKIPMNVIMEKRISDQYRELETDQEIAAYLKLTGGKSLPDVLRENGYAPFVTLVTTRRKYKKGGYGIDLDSVDFGYCIAEIELIIDDETKTQETTSKIIGYAKMHGIEGDTVRGKVAEYLRRNRREHFQVLLNAGVISRTHLENEPAGFADNSRARDPIFPLRYAGRLRQGERGICRSSEGEIGFSQPGMGAKPADSAPSAIFETGSRLAQ